MEKLLLVKVGMDDVLLDDKGDARQHNQVLCTRSGPDTPSPPRGSVSNLRASP